MTKNDYFCQFLHKKQAKSEIKFPFLQKKNQIHLADWSNLLNFAADKRNSITNKRKVAKKNEWNDNDNSQMPSGSKTKVKQVCESTGGLYLVVRCVLWDYVSKNGCASAKLGNEFPFAFGLLVLWHIATSVEGFVIE